jgi:tRNA C32,U32 (ribose-2'-O)-methylase TrmJ
MMRDLRALCHRALLNTRELAIAEGIVHRILWVAKSRREAGS